MGAIKKYQKYKTSTDESDLLDKSTQKESIQKLKKRISNEIASCPAKQRKAASILERLINNKSNT